MSARRKLRDERETKIFGAECFHAALEGVVRAEEPGVFGVEAEDEAHDEFVEVLEVFCCGLRPVGGQQGIIDFADERACGAGEVELLLDVAVGDVDEEGETVIFFAEVGERDVLRLGVRMFHVVDEEVGEVARDNPARPLGVGQMARIALRLLEGFQECAVRLLDWCVERLAETFLLDDGVRGGDDDVDVADVRELDALLEAHEACGIVDAVDFLQELDPEALAVLLFISDARPFRREIRRGLCLSIHEDASL